MAAAAKEDRPEARVRKAALEEGWLWPVKILSKTQWLL